MTTSTIGGDAGIIFEPLPQGFRLGAAAIAKEQHKHPLYCVAWSTDIFSSPEGNDKDAGHSNRNDNPITPAESDSDFLLAENGLIWSAPLRSGGSGTVLPASARSLYSLSPVQGKHATTEEALESIARHAARGLSWQSLCGSQTGIIEC